MAQDHLPAEPPKRRTVRLHPVVTKRAPPLLIPCLDDDPPAITPRQLENMMLSRFHRREGARPPKKRQRKKRVPSSEWLTKVEVACLLGVHPGSIDRYRRRDPTFPPPYWLTGCTPRWKRDEVEKWLASRPRSARAPAFEKQFHRRRECLKKNA
jgi:predicted DNA-binding transcriptional regulator AlpA